MRIYGAKIGRAFGHKAFGHQERTERQRQEEFSTSLMEEAEGILVGRCTHLMWPAMWTPTENSKKWPQEEH
jgi:hypothetical protein